MPTLLANWRLIALGCALAGVLGLIGYMGHLKKEAAQQRLRAVQAEAAAQMRQTETKVIEQFHHDTKVIRETVEKEADAVEQMPSDAVPADVLERWRLGLRNVTNSAADD